jgi:DNA-binding NarL/FixJ family response regulator
MAVAEILGRDAEVQAVSRFLDGPTPAALILEGPAGIGKTTVWRAGVERAQHLGHRILATRPSQVETAPAMAGLIDLLSEMLDQHGDVLPPPQRSALAVALLREDGAEAPPGAVSAAALRLLRRAAAECPVLGDRLDRPRILCVTRRAEAMLAAGRGDQDTAETLLEEALDIHDRFPVPLERGRTLLALGMTHRRAKHRRAARDRLHEAEALFDDMGAAIWRDRARRELGRISGRAARDHDALTSTERQIAELVATGKTNREVAAELFVTVSTVEANLTRVYRKLGVRSRTELARWFASAAPK